MTLSEFRTRADGHYVRKVVRACGGSQQLAAKVLGVHRNTMVKLCKAHGIKTRRVWVNRSALR